MKSKSGLGKMIVAGAGVILWVGQTWAGLAVPAYNSRPGAYAQLFLDFDGIDYARQAGWPSAPQNAPAYSIDSDTANFSSTELANIREIFLRVAEKYSPFNINVTTVDPKNDNNKQTAHVVISGSSSWYGKDAGGVAFVEGFTNSLSNIAWVFPGQLSNGYPKYVAEAAAHEAGHLFGLSHQTTWAQIDGKWVETDSNGYSTNNNDPARRPIMGSSYGSTRGLWWYGTSTSYRTYQDDLSILSNSNNGFGYRADDFGNTLATASPLAADSQGKFSITGVIEKTTDQDFFSFSTGLGQVSLLLSGAPYGPMLDSTMKLFNAAGTLLRTIDTASLSESLSMVLAAGSYTVGVSSHGSYGDVGQYTLSGTVVPMAAVPEPALAGVMVLAGVFVMSRRRGPDSSGEGR